MGAQGNVEDPRKSEVKPPFPKQPQEPPGLEEQMEPRPDFGEDTYKGSDKLVDKVALITGADSGIGRAAALAFAREGADIVFSYLPEEEPDAEKTIEVIKESGREAVGIAGDIQDESFCQNLVKQCVDKFGHLDILVNNAAFQMSHDAITEIPSEEVDRTFRTNIYAMFYLCKSAVPVMKAGGTIINVASIQAYQPSPNLLAYAATKGAIVTFSKALSHELAQKGIRVNVVAPGPVWTPLIPSTFPHEKVKDFGTNTPLGRPAQPAEIAPVFVFLAADDSRYITGEVVGVTGGKFTA